MVGMIVFMVCLLTYFLQMSKNADKRHFFTKLPRDLGIRVLIVLVIAFVASLCGMDRLGIQFLYAFVGLFVLGIPLLPAWLFYTISVKAEDRAIKKNQKAQFGNNPYGNQQYGCTPSQQAVTNPFELLPKDRVDRARIVVKFNEKYNLCLTDADIEVMVNSSYYSREWACEIIAMQENYHTEYEWLGSGLSWLRVYLKVFNVQDISSDMQFQKTNCLNYFNAVFKFVSEEKFDTMNECIRGVNEHFLTNFDEPTFMFAYRFLQDNGKNYKIPVGTVLAVDDELEEMQSRYENSPLQ